MIVYYCIAMDKEIVILLTVLWHDHKPLSDCGLSALEVFFV